jgi:SAM-dependent methyltransferase
MFFTADALVFFYLGCCWMSVSSEGYIPICAVTILFWRSNMASLCPLCQSELEIQVNEFGIHCEGLNCSVCGCNARNRYFYFVLGRIIKELGATNLREPPLQVLEASSYGYASLGDRYTEIMRANGANVHCSDFYESNFKAVSKEDLAALTFEDCSLDVICHSHVLEHIEKDLAALEEARRVLRPGGVLLISVPIQTDDTFSPIDEYHGDDAYVYRRNGWDLVQKVREAGFLVDILVPPEHVAMTPENKPKAEQFVLDDISFGKKFGNNYDLHRESFYSVCLEETSREQRFGEIWGQLEAFVARKPNMR